MQSHFFVVDIVIVVVASEVAYFESYIRTWATIGLALARAITSRARSFMQSRILSRTRPRAPFASRNNRREENDVVFLLDYYFLIGIRIVVICAPIRSARRDRGAQVYVNVCKRGKKEIITKKWKLINSIRCWGRNAGTRGAKEARGGEKEREVDGYRRFAERCFRGLEMVRALITVVR